METIPIILSLRPKLAQAYQAASAAKRLQIQHLVEDALEPLEQMDDALRTERIITQAEAEKAAGMNQEQAKRELFQTMNQIGTYASKQGLTESNLQNLLDEND